MSQSDDRRSMDELPIESGLGSPTLADQLGDVDGAELDFEPGRLGVEGRPVDL